MRKSIRFVLDGQVRELSRLDPTMTVLEYLRLNEKRFGTKEGCAEGDCGACTVVLGDLDGGELRYRAVNACIQFLPTLDGKLLLTVEDLTSADGALHPVQQALIETDGSQCGFCTPGFVMSIFALTRECSAPDRHTINDALAGNLCRCTGYGPIVAAAELASARDMDNSVKFREQDLAELLSGISVDEPVEIASGEALYFAPATTEQLGRWLADHPTATVLAGGTDVGLWVTKQDRDLDAVAYVGNVDQLKTINETEQKISIGSAVTLSDAFDVIAASYPDLGELLRRFGSRQVRNLGTFGGNIANGSPIGDTLPALIALGSTLHLGSATGRRSMPLKDFFIGYGEQDLKPGEFIDTVDMPKLERDQHFRVYKLSKRFDQDISAVCGAFWANVVGRTVQDIRVCFGGMAGTPKRASACEATLSGNAWTETSVADAQLALEEDFQPVSDMRGSASYRLQAAKNLLLKFFLETTEQAPQTRILDREKRQVAGDV